MSKNVNYIYTSLVLSNDVNRGGISICKSKSLRQLAEDLGVKTKKRAFETPSLISVYFTFIILCPALRMVCVEDE